MYHLLQTKFFPILIAKSLKLNLMFIPKNYLVNGKKKSDIKDFVNRNKKFSVKIIWLDY